MSPHHMISLHIVSAPGLCQTRPHHKVFCSYSHVAVRVALRSSWRLPVRTTTAAARHALTRINIAGKEATKEFDDVGHSNDAIKQLGDFYIGELEVCLGSVSVAMPDT